jgi:adenosylhomocysteine nucleosidase
MKRIGIIGAMGKEVALLRQRMEGCALEKWAGREFFIGRLNGKEAVVVESGIGKVNAAMTAQLLIDHYQVEAIVNTGVAGGGDNRIKVRDMVISTEVTYHDMDLEILAQGYPNLRFFQADPGLAAAAEEACKKGGIPYCVGRIATGDQFISDRDVKADIVSRLSPFAVEMEGGAVAHVCAANEIPFLVLRSISDNADDDAWVSYEEFVKIAADDAANVLFSMLERL